MLSEVIQSIQGYTPSDFIYKLKLTILNYDKAFEDQNSFLNLNKLNNQWVNLDWIYLGKNCVGPKYMYKRLLFVIIL
jgi:hypothetical protein